MVKWGGGESSWCECDADAVVYTEWNAIKVSSHGRFNWCPAYEKEEHIVPNHCVVVVYCRMFKTAICCGLKAI